MDKQTKVKVTNKWEGDFVIIYSIKQRFRSTSVVL